MFEFLLFAQAGASAGIGSLSEIWQHIIADFSNITQPSQLAAFGQVLAIDLLLAGDNVRVGQCRILTKFCTATRAYVRTEILAR